MPLLKVNTIAIGGFDGMHVGHQKLFDALGNKGAIVVVETGHANLTPGTNREYYSKHPIVYYSLDQIRHLDGMEFITMLKQQFPVLEKIVVGYDFRFGKDRCYSHQDINVFFDGIVEVIDEVCIDGDSVHSNKIRTKLNEGDIAAANRYLGHNYLIQGKIVQGQGLGKKSLYPTFNVEPFGYLIPMEGVYVGLVQLDNEEHWNPSVIFIGHRLSTDNTFAFEVHVLNQTIEQCKTIKVDLINFLRKNKKFETLDELKLTIERDIFLAERELKLLSL